MTCFELLATLILRVRPLQSAATMRDSDLNTQLLKRMSFNGLLPVCLTPVSGDSHRGHSMIVHV